MGVSDFLMLSLAKLTVKVGKGVMDAVADSEVRLFSSQMFGHTHSPISQGFENCCLPRQTF